MMIICKEDNSNCEGNSDDAFFVDETSMGEPWNEFGKWFGERYCRAPGIIEQLAGIREHDYIKLKDADYVAIKEAVTNMGLHEALNKEKLLEYIKTHIDKHISTENW